MVSQQVTTLTRFMDFDADMIELAPQATLVKVHFDRESPQDPHRQWEYAFAIKAIQEWDWQRGPVGKVAEAYDIGGAGSPLLHMLEAMSILTQVIDPKFNMNLSQVADLIRRQVAHPAEIVTCISTIEHVPDEAGFVHDLAEVVAPGGLLFMTADAWNGYPGSKDTAHFHWLRERIYCPESWQKLQKFFIDLGFQPFGETDWTYHGDQLYGSYTFCSMALRKEV
jgi:hypothetical protein